MPARSAMRMNMSRYDFMIWWMPDGLLFDFTADDHCGSAHIVPTLALSATSTVYPSGERIMNIRAGDRRHPETLPYRCCLSTLAGFGRLCRAGPARTWARILEPKGNVKCFTYTITAFQLRNSLVFKVQRFVPRNERGTNAILRMRGFHLQGLFPKAFL